MDDLPDPSTLTDEELDKILTGEEPEEPVDENPEDQDDAEDEADDKSKESEDKDTEEDDASDTPEEDEEEDADDKDDKSKKPEPKDKKDGPISHREQMRVKDLLGKYGKPEDPGKPEVKDALDYDKELATDEETLKKLKDDREKVAATSFNEGLEQAKSMQFMTRLEIDAPRVEAKYPQLDPESPDFKEAAATDVNLLYLQLSGFDPQTQRVQNPNIRYSSFVDTVFALVNDLASQKAREITTTVKKQVAKTGLRPGGSSKKLDLSKSPEQMSDEELDAYLAQVLPS